MTSPADAAACDPRLQIGRFANHLRMHGYPIGFDELGLMVRMAAEVPIAQWKAVAPMWRSAVCGDRRQWDRFPALFDAFWFPHKVRGTVKVSGTARSGRSLPERVADLHARLDADSRPDATARAAWASDGAGADEAEPHSAHRAMGGASRGDPADTRPFAEWAPQDLERIEPVVAAFARRLRRVLMRRREAAGDGTLDVRASLRAACSSGGELIELALKRRRRRRPQVVVMVDVSRSMEAHAPLFLRIAKAFGECAGARVFVFHTRLAEITAMLRQPGARVQERINAVSFAFGGGTRIATNLADVLDGPLRGSLARRDLLLVCSDGFDADPPEQLAVELARVRQRGADVVWLHPTREPPASAAMRDASARVRAFVPVFDLRSLERLPAAI